MARVAVLQIPGVNCEYESVRALEAVGIEAAIVRFNEPASVLSEFDAYLLPGGFAFQDRIRAGAVAAKLPAVERIARESESGKPVVGICNGAQVLVEAGLVPGLRPGRVEAALAPNRAPRRPGYLCRWIRVRAGEGPGRGTFTSALAAGEVVPLPIAHGEGRFETADPDVRAAIEGEGLALLRYVAADGAPARAYPDDPNGSMLQAAGLTNRAGNVLALMPHPERAAQLKHVPLDWPGPWGDRRRAAAGRFDALEGPGPGRFLFESLARRLGAAVPSGAIR
ncbi:MAG TPA: phosphoribosylformylglycinamidine synthase I [Candidatus Eisenbacteria bacterium]